MAIVVLSTKNPGDPTLASDANTLTSNDQDLDSRLSGLSPYVSNGSFEQNAGSNTAPSGWALTMPTNYSCNIETSAANTAHGAKAFSMTNGGSGVGGVAIVQVNKATCSPLVPLALRWLFKSSAATTVNSVVVNWFTEAGATVSSTTVWSNSSTNPTSWTQMGGQIVPPATAQLFTVQLNGVGTGSGSNTVYWDGVEVLPQLAVAAIFTGAGTFTYTPYTNVIKAKLMGGGGGGGGGGGAYSGSPSANPGNTGGNGGSSWVLSSTYVARGGSGGPGGGGGNSPTGPVPGAAVAAAAFITQAGVGFQYGMPASVAGLQGVANNGGGDGAQATVAAPWQTVGTTPGASTSSGNGNSATGAAGPGQGGSGGGGGNSNNGGAGGAAGQPGEIAEYVIPVTPFTALTVTVGAAGTAGAGATGAQYTGGAGAAGGAGWVMIEG